MRRDGDGLIAETAVPQAEWGWLNHYFQTGVELETVLRTFPADSPLREAVLACRGLRLLRQEPWECLASFILSSTKQIVQIRQIVGELCLRYGAPVPAGPGQLPTHGFPTIEAIARADEAGLRACKMGFRAPYLLGTARMLVKGDVDLDALHTMTQDRAREMLLRLPGVGRKIADCVLLFAYGFSETFPVDVWVLKALRQLYFPGRKPSPVRLRRFADSHFGPHGGYAQQYLFHYMRTRPRTPASGSRGRGPTN
jgi:N-glycosylase/DNA lyase